MSSDDVPSNKTSSHDDHVYDSVPDVNSLAKEDEQEDCGNQEQQDQEERASISSTSVFDHKRNSDVYLVSIVYLQSGEGERWSTG